MGAKSSVDDLGTCLGVVRSRAATILRSIETHPLTGRFVSSARDSCRCLRKHRFLFFLNFYLFVCSGGFAVDSLFFFFPKSVVPRCSETGWYVVQSIRLYDVLRRFSVSRVCVFWLLRELESSLKIYMYIFFSMRILFLCSGIFLFVFKVSSVCVFCSSGGGFLELSILYFVEIDERFYEVRI